MESLCFRFRSWKLKERGRRSKMETCFNKLGTSKYSCCIPFPFSTTWMQDLFTSVNFNYNRNHSFGWKFTYKHKQYSIHNGNWCCLLKQWFAGRNGKMNLFSSLLRWSVRGLAMPEMSGSCQYKVVEEERKELC